MKFLAGLLALLAAVGYAQQPIRDLKADSWVAVDGLGRRVANGSPPLRAKDRTVGMFYFLANHVVGQPVFDITKLLATNPTNPSYGPYGSPHWWGEPWVGYYQSEDLWVIRKHMQMLANAGVDVVIFDNTNGPTYPDVYLPLCDVLEEMKHDGLKTPKIAFFTGHGAWTTVDRDLYEKNLYPDLWFRWKGKPLMLAHVEGTDTVPQLIRDRFSVRESWAWTTGGWFGDGQDKWAWLDNYPQHFGWHESKSIPEEISVTVGQHATSSIGRSSLAQKEPELNQQKISEQTPDGLCFAQQFEEALKVDPEFIFVTGWNEWTATRFRMDHAGIMAGKPEPEGGSFFVDEYNAEFSRDIEPAKGLLQDNYYYQLCSFVRRYKGTRSLNPISYRSIDLKRGFAQWGPVSPEFEDAAGDTKHRDHPGWDKLHFSDNSGRNDIVAAKVAEDAKDLYFYVRCKDQLTSYRDPNWMLLFLNIGGRYDKGWLGYDFVVNRDIRSGLTSLERNVDGHYRWQRVSDVVWRAQGSELEIAIPKSKLGMIKASKIVDFKWADNIQQTGEISDFTLHGDAAPDDRFNYRAILR